MRHKWWTQPSRVVAYLSDTNDTAGDPSLVKMLCLGFAVVCVSDMRTHGIGAANSALCIVCLATAFGRSTFLAWLNRYTVTQDVSASLKTNVDVEADLAPMIKAVADRMSPHSPHGAE